MPKRKDLMDSGSSEDEDSSNSSSEDESRVRKRQNSGSGSEENKKKTRRLQENSGSSSSSDDSDDSEDDKKETPSIVQPVKIAAAVVPLTPQNKSDIEDGELSSESGGGEEEEDESSSNSEFDDGLGEDLMGDEQDREFLEKLSEKEREQELFKRAEKRDELRRRWEIERKLKLTKRVEKDKNKAFKKPAPKKKPPVARKAPEKIPKIVNQSTAEDSILPEGDDMDDMGDFGDIRDDYFDPKERSKERKKNVEMNKTDDKRSSAMAMLKARREGKQKRDNEREAQKVVQEDEREELEGVGEKSSSVKLKARDVYSDDSDSDSSKPSRDGRRSRSSSRSSSGSDSDDGGSQTTVKKPVFISSRDDLNKLRLSRFKLEKFINLPTFERTAVGCFVRINIGNNTATQKIVYRVAEIVSVVETPKIYLFGTSRTNKGLKLRHGPTERVFRLEFVSNQDFTDSEFDKWKEICQKSNITLPTTEQIEHKKKDIENALNYEFKEEDIEKIIQEKNRFRAHPTNYAMKKTQLMKERDASILQGDEERANEINLQIQELEERANELDKKRTSTIQLISYINNRNRRKNVEEAEKAILEEARATKGLKHADPFTRRSTKPTMTGKASRPDDDMVVAPEIPKAQKHKERRNEENFSADNLYSLHDFEVDLEVPLPMSIAALPKPVQNSKPQDTGPKIKRSLNLEDYKKKRGLI